MILCILQGMAHLSCEIWAGPFSLSIIISSGGFLDCIWPKGYTILHLFTSFSAKLVIDTFPVVLLMSVTDSSYWKLIVFVASSTTDHEGNTCDVHKHHNALAKIPIVKTNESNLTQTLDSVSSVSHTPYLMPVNLQAVGISAVHSELCQSRAGKNDSCNLKTLIKNDLVFHLTAWRCI